METETGFNTAAAAGTGMGTGIADAPGRVVPDATPEAAVADPGDVDAVEALLDQVEHALARLDDGSYGRCEVCGTIIADNRLVERPTARTCAGCPEPAAD
jgi:hypothetical protein